MSDELKILLKRPPREHKIDLIDHEETATLGLLVIKTPSRILTRGFNKKIRKPREGPLVSAYPIAEWLAWNWWRLTSEIGERPTDKLAARAWDFSHRVSTVGSGYDWPNISIHSDSHRSYLGSIQSKPDSVRSFAYYDSSVAVVSTKALERAMSDFIENTIKLLENKGIRDSNLQCLWRDLKSERVSPDGSCYRAMEARLGFNPDDLNENTIFRILDNAESIGRDALNEVAADEARAGNAAHNFPSTETFRNASAEFGVDVSLDSMAALSGNFSDHHNGMWNYGEEEAWRIGKKLAGMLRSQESLNGRSVSNRNLAQYAGLNESAITDETKSWNKMSFCFKNDNAMSKMTLRPKWETGRRFELARLVGDCVARKFWKLPEERLSPATGTSSYRQKLQRAFAAELLCPIEYIDEIAGKDYSPEKQRNAADEFNVSERVVSWQIWNHNRISESSIL